MADLESIKKDIETLKEMLRRDMARIEKGPYQGDEYRIYRAGSPSKNIEMLRPFKVCLALFSDFTSITLLQDGYAVNETKGKPIRQGDIVELDVRVDMETMTLKIDAMTSRMAWFKEEPAQVIFERKFDPEAM